jgi:hypothetical protein
MPLNGCYRSPRPRRRRRARRTGRRHCAGSSRPRSGPWWRERRSGRRRGRHGDADGRRRARQIELPAVRRKTGTCEATTDEAVQDAESELLRVHVPRARCISFRPAHASHGWTSAQITHRHRRPRKTARKGGEDGPRRPCRRSCDV